MPTTPPLITVTTATLAGNRRTNQDHAVVTPHAAAVLDGATSWLPQDPARDGGWYARTLGAALTVRLEDAGRSLASVVGESIAELRDRFGHGPDDCPTSTVTILRWVGDRLDVYTLGDSPAVIYRRDGDPEVVYDARLEPVGAEHRVRYRQHLADGGGYDDRLAELVAGLQLAERERRNRPEGYWIAGSDPDAAEHAVTATFPREDVAAVLLATDGASADVMEYRRNTWADVRHQLDKGDPGAYLRDIHQAEVDDRDGLRWPRAKRHDDKTIAYVTLG